MRDLAALEAVLFVTESPVPVGELAEVLEIAVVQVEGLLTDRGVDYAVQVEQFGRTLFGSARYGAMFYVTVGQAKYCRSALAADGFEQGIVEEESDT